MGIKQAQNPTKQMTFQNARIKSTNLIIISHFNITENIILPRDSTKLQYHIALISHNLFAHDNNELRRLKKKHL